MDQFTGGGSRPLRPPDCGRCVRDVHGRDRATRRHCSLAPPVSKRHLNGAYLEIPSLADIPLCWRDRGDLEQIRLVKISLRWSGGVWPSIHPIGTTFSRAWLKYGRSLVRWMLAKFEHQSHVVEDCWIGCVKIVVETQ